MIPSVMVAILLSVIKEGGSADNLIPAKGWRQPAILSSSTKYNVPVGEVAELECKIANFGDSVRVWKNGTRVISVGKLQVKHDPRLNQKEEKLEIRGVNVWDTGTYSCEIESD